VGLLSRSGGGQSPATPPKTGTAATSAQAGAGAAAALPASGEVNGGRDDTSFETGDHLGGFSSATEAPVTLTPLDTPPGAQDGSWYMRATTAKPGGTLGKVFRAGVVADRQYSASFFVRSPTGAPVHGYVIFWAIGGSTAADSPPQLRFTTGPGWTRVATLPENLNTHPALLLRIVITDVNASLDIDNVQFRFSS
jgi:hypothetical protein